MRKRWLFAAAALFLCIFIGLYMLYQKPRSGVKGVEADLILPAEELYQQYVTAEDSANALYLDKVIEVEGTIQEIIDNHNAPGVMLKGGQEGGINCSLTDVAYLNGLTVGRKIRVKGRCTGFLMDVMLVDAIPVIK